MAGIPFVILVASLLFYLAATVAPNCLNMSSQILRERFSNGSLHSLARKSQKTSDEVNNVPWRCFANQTGQLCSCTIISKNYVLARSSCILDNQQSIQVHVGASNETNSEQIVGAFVLQTAEPTPAGIVGIKLERELEFTNRVTNIKLVDRVYDNYFGYVSGFGYKNGTYELEVFDAAIFEMECTVGLCVVGRQWPEVNTDKSGRTDFLDYYDERDDEFYFIGVLDRRYGINFAVYHKTKDMIKWVQKYLGGAVGSALRLSD